jgi:DIM1 family U5 snRNP protein
MAARGLLSSSICADIHCTELYDPVTLMFFFRNKHMMCDFGTGNNNKLNWVLEDKQELIDIIETIYRGAKKGRGLVVSPKGELILST